MIGAGYRSERRIFPWISREEFKSIYGELFSDDPELQQHALNRICVWQSRALHKLSVAIDSTYTIISANLAYQRSLHHQDDIEVNLRLRKDYSLALIRFVNHLTEKNQTKQYAQPIHILAAEIGVPEWIVELRHDATHGALPSLPVLRAGARWALNWLKTVYWEKQVANMELTETDLAVETDPAVETEPACISKRVHPADNPKKIVEDVLISYQQHRLNELINPAMKDPEAKNVMENLDRALLEHRAEFVPVLLREGYLVSTLKQLQPLGLYIKDLLDSSDLLLPATLVKFWMPLLRRLHHNKVIPLLLHCALSSLPSSLAADSNTLHSTQILRWVYTILYHIQIVEEGKGVSASNRVFKSTCSLPYKSLLQLALQSPISQGCSPLIDLLMNKQTTRVLSKENRRKYQRLAAIYFYKEIETDEVEGENSEEHTDIHTIEDLTKGINRKGGSNTSASLIQPCRDSLDWSRVPIGFLPNFSSLYPRLDLGAIHRKELEGEMSGIEDSMSSDEDLSTQPLNSSDPSEWNFNAVLKNVKIL
ncbi:hypothetical protein CHS0354_020295 [Potamilus streckersoni]|uniref:LAS1-like protein n=1 Tax=Potamilus streckersoni TaxID=2493646 RepID=A0AAE0S5E1_9BIVA|nr:hypothetical protein CHS0354_020295 [Potamilus streckersoni]